MTTLNPIASSASRREVPHPSADLRAQLHALLAPARAEGLHVEGLALAEALIDDSALQRLKKLVCNPASLAAIKQKAGRLEFIAEGPLPPELLLEPAAKSQPVFNQLVDYDLCKGCQLCIQVCPKHVYADDGFGKPDRQRRDEECTGNTQCGQCIYICPERAISLKMASPVYESTLFLQLENPFVPAEARRETPCDFVVQNPLAGSAHLDIGSALPADDLIAANRVLDAAGFHPLLERLGNPKHFVDAADPAAELAAWAQEAGRAPAMAARALRVLYAGLPVLHGLREGNYALGQVIRRIIDEILYAEVDSASPQGLQLLQGIVEAGYLAETYLGSKRRPIGGLLPPGTSTAWKTPYGNEIPDYTHVEKCLGPECALCVTHCPEGNGGTTSAIRMIPLTPLGTIPALVRGLRVHLLRLDGSHAKTGDMEDLFGKAAIAFEVDADYCKACGICIACCPHDVIEPAARTFDMGEKL